MYIYATLCIEACTALASRTHIRPHSFLQRRRARPARECRMWELVNVPLLVPKQKGRSAAIWNPRQNSRKLKTNSIFNGLLLRPFRESLIVHWAFTSMDNNLKLALHPHPGLRLLLLTPGIKNLIPRTFQWRTKFPRPFQSIGNYMMSGNYIMLKPPTSSAAAQVPDTEINKCSSWLEAFAKSD